MDKEIPKEEIRKNQIKTALKVGVPIVVALVVAVVVILSIGKPVKSSQLSFSVAETGEVENSVEAAGKVVPAFEEAIISPVSTRILEVYCQEGEKVTAGQPLLRLDLQSTETEVRKLTDELSMKQNEKEQTSLNSRTFLTNLEMQIEAKSLAVDELASEVRNERRLDSLGSGTGDRVRQAELAYHTALIELEQLRKQLGNERQSHAAAYRSKQLEEGIYHKNLDEARRKLDEARILSPRTATLTYINSNVGSSVAAGEKLAVVSDLEHFRIEGEIPEGESDKVSAGSAVGIKLGGSRLRGRVSHVVPQASNGMIHFTVVLDKEDETKLRSGIKVDLNVVCGLKDNVVRIANGQYFHGPGQYTLFVVSPDGDSLEAREVNLGDSNFDWVEVIHGIKPGEKVVTTDMSDMKDRKSIKLDKN